MRPQRVPIIGISSGWVTLKKPFSVTSITLDHWSRRHAGHHRVVMDAGIVDQDLDDARLAEFSQCGRCGLGVGDIELDRFGRSAIGLDRGGNRLCLRLVLIAMDDDVNAAGSERPANRLANGAAAAGDQRAFHGIDPASTTAARPSTTTRPAELTENW